MRHDYLRAVWTLDPTVTFLNHGSFGSCPRAVLDAQTRWRERLEAEPVRLLARELEPLVDDVRAQVTEFIGASTEGLVFVSNATTGVNAVLRSQQFSAPDELLTTSHAYNACVNALRFTGAKVVVAEVPFPLSSPEQVVDAVLAKVTPRTKLAMVDHVTSPTGLVFPVEALVRGLKARGVRVLIDGAHAPGMIPLRLGDLGADWYTGNLHKWVCAPKSVAFLWAAEDVRASLRPLVIGHGANSTRTDRSRLHLEFDWPGTHDPTPLLCVPDALKALASCAPGGLPEVMQRNRALALAGRQVLLDALSVSSPAPESMIGSLAAVPLPNARADLQDWLFKEHRIEVPIVPWNGGALVRISAQQYNRLEQYQQLAAALTAQ